MTTTKTIQSRQQQKYSTSTEWSNANPLLLKGEIAVVKIGNSYRFKVGDGTSKYNALPFVDEGALADKVDKYKTVFIGQGVYGFTGDGSTVTENTIFTDGQATNISGTIPLRITDGNIPVPVTPTNNTDAASKKYVDDSGKPFVVTVTYGNDNTYIADKTYAEIVEAYATGEQINAKIVNFPGVVVPSTLPLFVKNSDDNVFMFSGSGCTNNSILIMTATNTNGNWSVNLTEAAQQDEVFTTLENKLDKITSTDTSATARVYSITNGGAQSSLKVTNITPTMNYLAQYNTDGRLKAYAPVVDVDVANKKYVDDAVAGAGGGSSFDAAYVPAGIQAGSGSWCTYKYLNENTVYVQFNIKNNSYTGRTADGYLYVGRGLPVPALYSSAYYAGNILCESAKVTTGTIDGMTTIAISEDGYLITPSVSSAIKDVYGSLTYPTNEKHYATYKLTGYPSTTLSAETIQFMANGTKYYGIRAINMGTDAYDVEYKTSSSGSSWTTAFDGTSMSWQGLGILTFLAEPSSTLVTWMLRYGSKL